MLFLLDALNRLLNRLFAGPVDALLAAVHVRPEFPTHPISNGLTLELIIFLALVLFFALVRASLNVEKPGSLQLLAEQIDGFVAGQAESVMGHEYERHLPILVSIPLFVLLCNVMGLLPGIETPTSNPSVPLALALITFAYYNLVGIRAQGPVGYFKHFLGPVGWIAPLMLPIEIISHLARIMSLKVRLYANMFASDLLTLVLFSLVPVGIAMIFLGLHLGVALIQAYVFMLLATI